MEAILMWILTENPRSLLLAIPQLLLLIGGIVVVVLIIRALRSIDRSLKELLARTSGSPTGPQGVGA